MYCTNCGKELNEETKFCPECGQKVGEIPQQIAPQVIIVKEKKTKSKIVALLLCLFLGEIGLHDFYLDKPYKGLCKILILIFLGWFWLLGFIIVGIWCIIDFLDIAFSTEEGLGFNKQEQKADNSYENEELSEKEKPSKINLWFAIIGFIIFLIILAVIKGLFN